MASDFFVGGKKVTMTLESFSKNPVRNDLHIPKKCIMEMIEKCRKEDFTIIKDCSKSGNDFCKYLYTFEYSPYVWPTEWFFETKKQLEFEF